MEPTTLPVFPVHFEKPSSTQAWLELAKAHHIRIEVPENAEEEIKEELAFRSKLTAMFTSFFKSIPEARPILQAQDQLSQNFEAQRVWPLIWDDHKQDLQSYAPFVFEPTTYLYLLQNRVFNTDNYQFIDWPYFIYSTKQKMINFDEKHQRDFADLLGKIMEQSFQENKGRRLLDIETADLYYNLSKRFKRPDLWTYFDAKKLKIK